jgi:hypothetical protein
MTAPGEEDNAQGAQGSTIDYRSEEGNLSGKKARGEKKSKKDAKSCTGV